MIAAHHGNRVLFATAVDWVTRLQDAHRLGRLPAELSRLRRHGLIIIGEVGYLPFEQDAANLVFQLVSSRYEHASLVLTSNLPFSSWGGVFGDQAVAAAMVKASAPEVERSHRATFSPGEPLPITAETMATIHQPVLIVHGDTDRLMPLECGEWYHSVLPNSRLRVVDHAGHWLQIEHRDLFRDLVREFLGAHEPSNGDE